MCLRAKPQKMRPRKLRAVGLKLFARKSRLLSLNEMCRKLYGLKLRYVSPCLNSPICLSLEFGLQIHICLRSQLIEIFQFWENKFGVWVYRGTTIRPDSWPLKRPYKWPPIRPLTLKLGGGARATAIRPLISKFHITTHPRIWLCEWLQNWEKIGARNAYKAIQPQLCGIIVVPL